MDYLSHQPVQLQELFDYGEHVKRHQNGQSKIRVISSALKKEKGYWSAGLFIQSQANANYVMLLLLATLKVLLYGVACQAFCVFKTT